MISYKLVIIASAIGIIPVTFWIWLVINYNRKHYRGESFFMKLFFWGVLSAIPASIFEIYLIESQGNGVLLNAMQSVWSYERAANILPALVSVFLVAVIEEFSKGVAILKASFSDRLRIHNDGLVFGILVGLAFAVTENGVYFSSAIGSQELSQLIPIVVLRFFLSTSAHIIYSGLMGKFMADAILSVSSSQRAAKLALAFFLPVVIHAAFNFFLSTSLNWLISFIIVFGMYGLWLIYSRQSKEKEEFIRT